MEDIIDFLFEQAESLSRQDRWIDSMPLYKRAYKMANQDENADPKYRERYVAACGRCWFELGIDDLEEALTYSLENFDPKKLPQVVNISQMYFRLGRYSEARDYAERALRVPGGDQEGNVYSLFVRLALVAEDPYDAMNEVGEMLEKQALVLCNNKAHVNTMLSQVLMYDEKMDQGLALYEERLKISDPKMIERQGFWSPGLLKDPSELRDKHVMMVAEQGFGDSIMMLRYASKLKKFGVKKITAMVPPELSSLNVDGVDEMRPSVLQPPEYDLFVPMMSLPQRMLWGKKFHEESFPYASRVPYIRADPKTEDSWREKLNWEGKIVGICWASGRQHLVANNRSFHLSQFLPIIDAAQEKGARVVSLQAGPDKDQLRRMNLMERVLPTHLPTWGVTAALIANLDLVVTSDTGVAHLAAAMGTPTICFIPFFGDWRWEMPGNPEYTTKWYLTMTTVRQRKFGDWRNELVFAAEKVKDLL